jgi:ATP-dependent DNA helicase RecQ
VIRAFVESHDCRHRQICTHFGETPKWASCAACDVCGSTPDWLKETLTPAAARRAIVASGSKRDAKEHVAEGDQELREYLREWRRTTAKEQGVPAFVVMHDATLDEICRLKPKSITELMRVSGIGERKADTYGQKILAALRRYDDGSRASVLPGKNYRAGAGNLAAFVSGKDDRGDRSDSRPPAFYCDQRRNRAGGERRN